MDILLIRNCENAAGRFVCSLACSKFARSVGFVSCPAGEYVCVAFNAFSREVYGFGYETSKLPRGTVICMYQKGKRHRVFLIFSTNGQGASHMEIPWRWQRSSSWLTHIHTCPVNKLSPFKQRKVQLSVLCLSCIQVNSFNN